MNFEDHNPEENFLLFLEDCKNANLGGVLKFLSCKGEDPSRSSSCCVSIASIYGHADILSVLLTDPRIQPQKADNPFEVASTRGHLEVIKWLLRNGKSDPSQDDNRAVKKAARHGHVEILRLLLGDERVSDTVSKCQLLYRVCCNGHFECLKVLFEEYNYDIHDGVDQALKLACDNDQKLIIYYLAGRRFGFEFVDPSPALQWACRVGNDWYVNKLLSTFLIPVAFQELITAIKGGHLKVVQLLLKNHCIDPGAEHNEAITAAAFRNDSGILRVLLKDPRVDPSAENSRPLRAAVTNGYYTIAEILLQDGRVDVGDCYPDAVNCAKQMKYDQILALLNSYQMNGNAN